MAGDLSGRSSAMDPADMQAFARAQALLSRKEDLDDLPPMAPLRWTTEEMPS